MAVLKNRSSAREEILSAQELSSIFGKIQRKIFDFKDTQYIQVFPIMYGEEEHSYVKCVKYFRNREFNKKNYKTAEHYVSNWISRNDTIEELESKFIDTLRKNED